jgi:tetratricopeptide (TPR) repeat protein
VARARQVTRDFSLSAADTLPVAHICRLCSGMPLALELAAAAVRYHSPAQIAGQLQSSWQTLSAAYGDLPERHQSIQAAFEHSWALLPAREQGVFSRLSVFQGGFDQDAADQVARASREALPALIDKSLVQRAGADRFAMHPLIYQYAAQKLRQLGQYEETRGRHLDYFLNLAGRGEEKLKGRDQIPWSNRLEMEHRNMLTAIAWGMEADLEGAARLAAANWLFWFGHGHLTQGRQDYEALLARKAELPASLRARVLTGCAAMAWLQGDLERTAAVSEEGLRLFKELGDTEGISLSLHHLGIVAMNQGEYDRAYALFEEALVLARALPDSWLASVVLVDLGVNYQDQGQYERAKSAYHEALRLDEGREDRWAGHYAQGNLAHIAYEQGDFVEAKAQYQEVLPVVKDFGNKQILAEIYSKQGRMALDEGDLSQAAIYSEQALVISQELGSAVGIAESHTNLGDIAASRGYFDQAAAAYQDGARYYRQAAFQPGVTTCLERLAELAWLRTQAPQAVLWLAAAEAERTRLKLPRTPVEQQRYERRLKTIRAQLDEDTYSRLWAKGTATALDEALDEAQMPLSGPEV